MEPTEGPKKRGRKKKEQKVSDVQEQPAAPKKRGRKPKGGKIISKIEEPTTNHILTNNVILHLKCSMSDVKDNSVTELKYQPVAPPQIKTLENDQNYSYIVPNEGVNDIAYTSESVCSICKNNQTAHNNNDNNINIKDIDDKLKSLKIKLYNNLLPNVKSSCFWCTCSYDTPLCVIPKEITNDEIVGYGSFCRPECAVSFLFKENIDDAMKFERYQLLNSIYSKVYNYSKNIKPAPDPYYLLDKFYGTMTIQEYRKMLGSQHLLLVIDKPMTRTLPELHEDNDCFVNDLYVSNKNENKSQNTGKYKVKRESEKKSGPSKKSLIEEHFKLKS
jgi:hypothetical protein